MSVRVYQFTAWLAAVGSCLALASAAPAAVIVSEIFYNLGGSEGAAQEWIEITNTGNATVDLTGWTYGDSQDNTFTNPFPAGYELLAGESAVVVEQSAATFQGIWGAGIKVLTAGPGSSLANSASPTNETVAIRDAANAIIDEVNYENATNGWPDDGSGGMSIYLLPGAFDAASNDIGANWLNSTVGVHGAYTALTVNPDIANASAPDIASPGTAVAVPEPSAIVLASLLALCGASARRRR